MGTDRQKTNEVFLKSFTSVVEPKRLIWLVNNKERFVSDYTDANTLLNACLRTILGTGIRIAEYNTHFGNYFKLDKASDEVRTVVSELIAMVKQDDAKAPFAMAVLLQLVLKKRKRCAWNCSNLRVQVYSPCRSALLAKSSFANSKTSQHHSRKRIIPSRSLDFNLPLGERV